MEDAATAEISRAQVWQWIRHPRGALDDGRKVTKELFRSVLNEELAKIKTQIGGKRFANGKFDVARELFDRITTDDEFAEFLTLPGYEKLDEHPQRPARRRRPTPGQSAIPKKDERDEQSKREKHFRCRKEPGRNEKSRS